MQPKSLWVETSESTQFPPLKHDLSVDVAIVGGGITGLTAANILLRAGKTVAIVDNAQIAMGETGYTTAHLTQVLDHRYSKIIKDFGLDQARLIAESKLAAIQYIETMSREYGIACDFERVSGYLYTEHENKTEELEHELEALKKVGIQAEKLTAPLPFEIKHALRIPNQAQFHPRQYLLPLANVILELGGKIFENTRVHNVHEGTPCIVELETGTIKAKHVVISANVPVTNWLMINTKIAAYRSYAIAAKLNKSILPGLFWDTEDPYHYIRTYMNREGNYIIVGGEDHKTGTVTDTEACYARLEKYARKRFDITDIQYKWSGQMIEPLDGLAYIGLNSFSKHVYISTGYSGNGMTFGTLGAMIISDLILGFSNRWASIYDATRIHPLASASRYITENSDTLAHLIGDRIKGSDEHSLENIKNNEGKIVTIMGQTIAAYRTENGALKCCSAVCPHMGGIVHWNKAENSWDCPCHGSRFDKNGKVLNGPAVTDLTPVDHNTLSPSQVPVPA